MRTAEPYLQLTEADAAAQWLLVLSRQPKPRQDLFLPIETVLAFGLFYVLDPHRYGGGNIGRAPAEVHRLAATFNRSAGSITSKMLNLDGSRKNAGRMEPTVYLRLSADQGLFLTLYRRILAAGRALGLENDRLPDFLDAFEAPLEVLGQDELHDAEIAQLLREGQETVQSVMNAFQFDEQETVRLVEHRARLGQHRFARAVLRNYGHRCAFCGFSPHSIRNNGMLLASHIKPWSASTNRERLDPRNGVAACPIHDRAFDTGLLTVNGGLKIHRSDPLEASLVADAGSTAYFGAPVLRPRLIVPEQEAPGRIYLDYHKREVFQGRRAF